MMLDWEAHKRAHPDSILLYRCGDFYEMFYGDAEVAARVLGLTLTARNNGGAADVPLAGVPVRACAEYVRRLVSRGFRVTICEQVEDPKQAKGVVRREVVETVTPGAAFADELLDASRNTFVAAARADAGRVALAAADLSTGEFRLATAPLADADALLARYAARELLTERGAAALPGAASSGAGAPPDSASGGAPLLTARDAWEFDPALGADELRRQYALGPDALGLVASGDELLLGAAGALLRYLRELQPAGLPHLARPTVERAGGAMPLDEMTRRNLELVESLRPGAGEDGGEAGTLVAVLDRTATPMGARLLRRWLLAPLVDVAAIDARLGAVAAFAAAPLARGALREALDGVRDVERLAGKAAANRATPRELRLLGDSLARLPDGRAALARVLDDVSAEVTAGGRLAAIGAEWDEMAAGVGALAGALAAALVARPPLQLGGDEPTVAGGVDAALDRARALRDGGRDAIAAIQQHERARTGIPSLKVGFNRVFGYFLEVTNAHRHLVPADFQRRQTLAGAERYVTPALKEHEAAVLGAAETIEARERAVCDALRARVGAEIEPLQRAAARLAELDVLAALADVAEREGYVRPEVTDGFDLDVVGGRHPVVERMMPRERFIPNDLQLTDDARLVVLTGPNMAGKSTVLRQTGLIVLMAQVGSFVPASRARVGVVDRLFTRVGASDNLVRGQSTFMVEMTETAAILAAATRRSLVLLDEIGRGTSTYDGVSIAWSVSEHLHDAVGCKTVFATHYHELVALADDLAAARNMTVLVRETEDRVLFLHRLVPGGADRSYGIEVGRLAGLPAPVIARAKAVLATLEAQQHPPAADGPATEGPAGDGRRRARRVSPVAPADQLPLFAPPPAPHPALEALRAVDPNHLTPMQALELLARLAAQAQATPP
ncbi:DNA mismatch repair protein MutS [Gemmatimonadetes bacterium T265]|nr:DNA mismatch repair protein MutS [Gemmatimonadetes bacterium T265]